MGCPKAFSIKGGMGAALLRAPEKAKAIMSALVKALPGLPITCKIRLLPTEGETLALVRGLVSTGITAIGVHGRLTAQRPREPVTEAQMALIRKIAEECPIPVIANGGSLDITKFSDIESFRESSGCAAVMVARAAQWNLSVFRPEGPLEVDTVCKEYLKVAAKYDNAWENSKYCLMSMYKNDQLSTTGERLRIASSMRELCAVWGIEHELDAELEIRRQKAVELGLPSSSIGDDDVSEGDGDDGRPRKRARVERIDDRDVTIMDITFNPREVVDGANPKVKLINYCTRQGLPAPQYVCRQLPDKRFVAVCTAIDGRYSSSIGHANKRRAEQCAAQVCLDVVGLKLNRDGTLVQA